MPTTVVFKLGGHIATGELQALARVIRIVQSAGNRVFVVHGGGPSISRALQERGLEMPFVNGLRRTSHEAMEVVACVLQSEVNPRVVQGLRDAGVSAARGLHEPGMLHAAPVAGLERTGRVTRVGSAQLVHRMNHGEVPVLAPLGVGEDGALYNVNADLAAAAIAGALAADRIVFLTDVHGIYENLAEAKLIRLSSPKALVAMRDDGCFRGGMLPKVDAILEALHGGANHAFVVHGQDESALQWAVRCNPERPNVDWLIRGTCVSNAKEEMSRWG